MSVSYALRPIQSSDFGFLFKLYSTTRYDVQVMPGWNTKQKNQFLRIQFEAQHSHYTKVFSDGSFNLILDENNNRVGRLYTYQTRDELRVVDIAILPTHQRLGIGSSILKEITHRARAASLPVRLQVAKDNTALNWYLKSGFNQFDTTETTYQLEWSPVSIFFSNNRPTTATQ